MKNKIRKYKTRELLKFAAIADTPFRDEQRAKVPFKDRFNSALMDAVLDYAKEESRRFNMSVWRACNSLNAPAGHPMPPCNTVTCLGGTAVHLSALYPNAVARRLAYISDRYFRTARELFVLTYDEGRRLFLPEAWPREFMFNDWESWHMLDKKGKHIKPGTRAYVNRTIDRVRLFVKTEGRE